MNRKEFIEKLVAVGNEYMIEKERKDGSKFIGFKPGRPDFLSNLIDEVKERTECNDTEWAITFLYYAFIKLEGVEEWEELRVEYNPTYAELTDWLISHSAKVDDYIEEGEEHALDLIRSRGIMHVIENAFERHFYDAVHAVMEYLGELADNRENE